MKYKSLEEACRAISKSLGDVMANEVLDTVREAEVLAIEEYVYKAGRPKRYKRRYGNGGLSDIDNIQGTVAASGKGAQLSVVNLTPPNPVYDGANATTDKYLPAVVEYGVVEKYDMGEGWWSDPRPFTLATEGFLNSTKSHVDAIQNGLTRHGFTVRKK